MPNGEISALLHTPKKNTCDFPQLALFIDPMTTVSTQLLHIFGHMAPCQCYIVEATHAMRQYMHVSALHGAFWAFYPIRQELALPSEAIVMARF